MENTKLEQNVDELTNEVAGLKQSELRLQEITQDQQVSTSALVDLGKTNQLILEKKKEVIRDFGEDDDLPRGMLREAEEPVVIPAFSGNIR